MIDAAADRPLAELTVRELRDLLEAAAVQPEFYTIQDVARMLRVTPRTVDRLAARGEIPSATKVGGSKLWPRSAVDTFLSRQAKASEAEQARRARVGALTR